MLLAKNTCNLWERREILPKIPCQKEKEIYPHIKKQKKEPTSIDRLKNLQYITTNAPTTHTCDSHHSNATQDL
jgi:hypothetical protein